MTRSWEAFQLAYESPRQRCERLLACARRLGARRWLWADVGAAIPLIELGVSSPSGASKLHDAPGVRRVKGGPLILQPRLFPLGRVPAWFAPVLAETGSRALSTLAADPGRPVAWSVVGAELRWLYTRLVPDVCERVRALAWYERWLSADTPVVVANPSAEHIHAALVARAAHIQVLRLRGPSAPPSEETALIRELRQTVSFRSRPDPEAEPMA
jgi:hypothetical protein